MYSDNGNRFFRCWVEGSILKGKGFRIKVLGSRIFCLKNLAWLALKIRDVFLGLKAVGRELAPESRAQMDSEIFGLGQL